MEKQVLILASCLVIGSAISTVGIYEDYLGCFNNKHDDLAIPSYIVHPDSNGKFLEAKERCKNETFQS